MPSIIRPRAVVDRRTLLAALEKLAAEQTPPPQQLVAFLKEALAAGRAEIRQRFDEDGSGVDAAHALSFLMDQLIRVLYDFTVGHVYPAANPTAGERMALVAVGGYGRGELAPFSDIDLLFLLPYKATPHTEQVVEYMLYALWDLGLKVGQSTRSIAETIAQAKADLTIRTAILEARYVWGDQQIFDEMKAAFDTEIVKGNAAAYVRDKLAERNDRHHRLGDSRYVVEPNVKEGKGGLRDLHTLFWIAKFAYRVDDVSKLVALQVFSEEEAARFARAQSFLWTVRCHLHFLAGRAEDRLTFDYQAEIGRRMGYTDHAGSRGVERFMKHYFLVAKDVGDLTRIICAVLESEHKARPLLAWRPWGVGRKKLEGFVVEGGRIDVEGEDAFRRHRLDLLRLFHVAEEHDLDIHPHALRLITHNLRLIDNHLRVDPEANRLFMEILTSRKDPEVALRRLNEAGVFGRFVPDFGRVVAQMQYDMYHIHTVDEHTIFAIGILAKIEKGLLKDELPLATSLVPTIDAASRSALYLAVLCHDIAKGRGGDHSILGEEVAQKLGPRLGLSAEETETVAWLVRWHLLMSATAFKRDIDDPKTISDFVDRVQSPERLKLLLMLTVVDIRAVGPKVWNGWKAALLRELYHRAADLMAGGLVEGHLERISRAQEDVVKLLPDFSRDEIESFVAKGYPFYWLSFEPEAMARHARLIREAERSGKPLTVEARVDPQRAVTEVTVYTADHAGLFSRIAGALALAGANIVDAKILTMQNGMALDTFTVQDQIGGAFDKPERLNRLEATLEGVLSGAIKAHVELARPPAIPPRTRTLALPPRVIINNTASATHTVIEVNGRDRAGLLFQVTRALTALNLQISSAKISTYGEKVVDVFYVKDLFGHKIEDEARLKIIREGVLAALTDPTAAQNPTVAAQ
ncbi:MAG: [protein-PII] uridylyltransferase [Alphaproteobacteria bacterium]|nr:[protein-PII] uridylyltransferase [Alphaproteobacteria bacterium]